MSFPIVTGSRCRLQWADSVSNRPYSRPQRSTLLCRRVFTTSKGWPTNVATTPAVNPAVVSTIDGDKASISAAPPAVARIKVLVSYCHQLAESLLALLLLEPLYSSSISKRTDRSCGHQVVCIEAFADVEFKDSFLCSNDNPSSMNRNQKHVIVLTDHCSKSKLSINVYSLNGVYISQEIL